MCAMIGHMGLGDEWTEYHLTPRGWEKGSFRRDGQPSRSQPTPGDRVATYRYEESVNKSLSGLNKSTERTWESDDKALLGKLLASFGPCPERM